MTLKTSKLTGKALENFVLAKLNDQVQPLTCIEVTAMLANDTGVNYHDVPVRNALNALVAAGLATKRTETDAERTIRANGGTPVGINATLFFTTLYGDTYVPARNVSVVVPGSKLMDSSERVFPNGRGRYAANLKAKAAAAEVAPRQKRKYVRRQPVAVAPVSPISEIETLINQVVEARTAELQAENQRLRDQLAKIKGLAS